MKASVYADMEDSEKQVADYLGRAQRRRARKKSK